MELSCGPPATTARHTRNDTTGASKVPPKAALRAGVAPLRDGRPGSWSDWLGATTQNLGRPAPSTLGTSVVDIAMKVVTTLWALAKTSPLDMQAHRLGVLDLEMGDEA